MRKKLIAAFITILGGLAFAQQKTWEKDPYYKDGEAVLHKEFNRALNYAVFYAFKDMKKKWKPATINGQPIDFRFKYQLTAITDPKD